MSRYPEFDLARVRTQPFAGRASKVLLEDFAAPPAAGRSFREFLQSLPNILAGPELAAIARAVVDARRADRAVVASLGGHVVKTGLAPVLIALAEQGLITAFAVNGALAIHDAEIALWGRTSEDVVAGLQSGLFGMAEETAAFYNGAIARAAREGLGAGEAIGRALVEADAPNAHASLLASAYRLGVPVTVHIALGTDIVHCHPNADGAALGEATLRDFRILTQCMAGLARGGVLMNLGSAVVLPEVLLKAVSLLRNQDPEGFTDFLGVNFDFIQHYRSNQQVVSRVRSIGGRGIALTGHHEIMIPLLAQAIVEEWADGTSVDMPSKMRLDAGPAPDEAVTTATNTFKSWLQTHLDVGHGITESVVRHAFLDSLQSNTEVVVRTETPHPTLRTARIDATLHRPKGQTFTAIEFKFHRTPTGGNVITYPMNAGSIFKDFARLLVLPAGSPAYLVYVATKKMANHLLKEKHNLGGVFGLRTGEQISWGADDMRLRPSTFHRTMGEWPAPAVIKCWENCSVGQEYHLWVFQVYPDAGPVN